MRAWSHAVVAVLLGALFLLSLRAPGLGDRAAGALSNVGQLAAVATAAVLCWLASRTPGSPTRAWRFMAVGVGAWAAGQAVWTYYEVVTEREVPFPSAADLGFLTFPVAAGIGLLYWLGTQHTMHVAARGRDLLDGSVIAVSLLVLSWVTSLRAVAESGDGGPFALTLSLAYPVGDVVLATLALLALARGSTEDRPVLLLLTAGLGCLAFADSAYVFLVSTGRYASADAVSSGWVFGFLLVGAAARLECTRPRVARPVPAGGLAPSLLGAALPYVPFGAAGVGLAVSLLGSPERRTADVTLGAALVVLVLSRQFLALVENQRLYAALESARDQLQHQVLHDPLTGLANRALFTDRLDRALRRPGHEIALLFCDLDDFKRINDVHGHDVGDLVLVGVGRRLAECVRAQDTVARLGGDEFAVLLEDPGDAGAVAERIVTATARPFDLRGTAVSLTVSVGTAFHRSPTDGTGLGRRTADLAARGRTEDTSHRLTGPDLLLRAADQAMYAAKTSGKGRAVMAGQIDGIDDPTAGEMAAG